jgi:hypothetical protein
MKLDTQLFTVPKMAWLITAGNVVDYAVHISETSC